MGLPSFLYFLKQVSVTFMITNICFLFFFPDMHGVTDLGYSRRSHSVHPFYSAESFSCEMTHQVPKAHSHHCGLGFLIPRPVFSLPGNLWTIIVLFTSKCYISIISSIINSLPQGEKSFLLQVNSSELCVTTCIAVLRKFLKQRPDWVGS